MYLKKMKVEDTLLSLLNIDLSFILEQQTLQVKLTLPAGTEMVMPGDDAKFTVKLITPIAMSEQLNFAIREGGRTVGAGVVTKIIE